MTNIFVRIRRDGGWQFVEIDQLTDNELNEFVYMICKESSAADAAKRGWNFVKALSIWIRENVK